MIAKNIFFSILIAVLLLIIPCNTAYSQYRTIDLATKKIVSLVKNKPSAGKILAGVANIRYKNSNLPKSVFSNEYEAINMLSIQNKDFSIIESYLDDKKCISSQKSRFDNYSKEQQAKILLLEEELKRTFIVEFDENLSFSEFSKIIKEKYLTIELVEPYYIVEPCGIPDDPMIASQTVLSTIRILESWDLCQGDSTVFIGISDSGFNWFHEDLIDGIEINKGETPDNGIDDDGNGYIDDYYGYNYAWLADGGSNFYGDIENSIINFHGTKVAGIIGARTNNGKGIAGIGYKCKIVPIKICRKNSDNYLYGYQSMLYAAVRGCKVLNCSWGSPTPYSLVSQSIVNYVTACDVAVVAAAGNLGGDFTDPYSTFYPASYYGVLGIGQTGSDDYVNLSRSILGIGCRLMAQGDGNYSINGSNDYLKLGWGSSYASPVVAGMIGILRSYKPDLTPIEAQETVRRAGESIRNASNNLGDGFIPVRANLYNAMKLNEQAEPSIILTEQYYETTAGLRTERFFEGDTAVLVLNLINILADCQNISVKLRNLFTLDASAFDWNYPSDSTWNIAEIKHNEEYPLKISFIVKKPSNIRYSFYALEMHSSSGIDAIYDDEIKFNLSISDNLTSFENQKLLISASDKGKLGYDIIRQNFTDGVGFEHKLLGDFLFDGGIIAVSDYQKAVSTNFDNEVDDGNSFDIVKGLYGSSPNISIIKDSRTNIDNQIGIEITTKYEFPSDSSSTFKMVLSAKNISGKKITDFAMGHYYDWDINNPSFDRVGYFPEAILDSLGTAWASAEYATDEHNSVYAGSLAFCDKNNSSNMYVIPQSAGISDYHPNSQGLVKNLTGGKSQQISENTDIQYVVGMHWTSDFLANDVVECTICTGIEKTKEQLANSLIECYKSSLTSIIGDENSEHFYALEFSNNSVNVIINNTSLFGAKIEMFNSMGMKIFDSIVAGNFVCIDFSNYCAGAYFLRLTGIIDSIITSDNIENKNYYIENFIWK